MKKNNLLIILLAFSSWVTAAIVVGPMSYQGRLLDDQGIPVTGTYEFKVTLYDDLVAGTNQYSEDQSAIAVDDGVYSFKVGEGTNQAGSYGWDTDLWQLNLNNLFMEIEVSDNGGTTYETLTPRHEVTSAPHAFTATLALSLGDRDIDEFDNILEGICVSSNGRWLNSTDTCAGGDVDLSNFGPADFDNNGDFTELEFDDADFSNTIFPGGAQFNETVFTEATFSNTNFSNASLVDTTIDGGTIGSSVNFDGAILDGMVIKNIDASNLDISGAASYIGFSAGKLTACPSDPWNQLPNGWTCLSYQDNGTTYYALVGQGVDLSVGSPTLTTRYGSDYLSIEAFTSQDLNGASFEGIQLGSDFQGTTLSDASFKNAKLVDADFQMGTSLDRTNFENAILSWVDFTNVDLTGQSGFPTVFINAELTNTTFANTYHDSYTDWDRAKLDSVTFDNVSGSGGSGDAVFDFVNSRLNDVTFRNSNLTLNFIDTPLKDVTFSNLTYGGIVSFNSGGAMNQIVLEDIIFENNISFGGGYDFANVILKNVTFDNEDLTGTNFYGDTQLINVKFLGVNLANNASFSNAVLDGITDWSGSTLTGLDFNGQDLTDVDFSGITAVNVNFQGAFMDGVNFAGATLTQSQFGGIAENSMLGINWRGATLTDAMMAGDFKSTNFSSLVAATGSDWSGSILRDTDFSDLDLSFSYFANTELVNANLSGTNLTDATLNSANLTYADLSGATLMGADFNSANLSYTDLSGTTLSGILNITGAQWFQTNLTSAVFSTTGSEIGFGVLNGSQFHDVQASSSDFSGFVTYDNLTFDRSTLSDTDFNNAGLANSQFVETDLDGADFSNTNLSNVYFIDSDLGGADFSNANLSNVNFDNSDLNSVDFSNVDLMGVADLCPGGITTPGPSSLAGVIWTNATCPDGIIMDGSPTRMNCLTDNHIPGCGGT